MDTSISISIGGLIAMILGLFTWSWKFKRDIKTENEQMIEAKVSDGINGVKSEIYPQINEMKTKQAEMHTDIKWIIKRLNGG